jgi:hypothetical protein
VESRKDVRKPVWGRGVEYNRTATGFAKRREYNGWKGSSKKQEEEEARRGSREQGKRSASARTEELVAGQKVKDRMDG